MARPPLPSPGKRETYGAVQPPIPSISEDATLAEELTQLTPGQQQQHTRGPSRRTLLDGWFRSDHSARNVFGNDGDDARRPARQTLFFGPSDSAVFDHSIAQRAGLQYKSVDRELTDTVVWHQRKKALLRQAESRRDDPSRDSWSTASRIVNGTGDYRFDLRAVSRLQRARTATDQLLCVAIGVAMAFVGLAVSRAADAILDRKLGAALERFAAGGFLSGMIVHVGVSALLGFAACLPVMYRPVSAGSGIAEAKATLNGVITPNCTSLLTALCKGLSVIMSVSASLPAGLEGPMIHLGLCVGENMNRLVPSHCQVLDPLRSDRARLDYAAIGTAAGVAAAFRAPVAGILFAMEEGASYWSTELTWRCFLSACVCVIATYGILQSSHSHSSNYFQITVMDIFNGLGEETVADETQIIPSGFVPRFNFWEYSVFALVGSLGGLVGAIFCTLNRAIAVTRRKMNMGIALKGLEVVALTVIYASLIWILPHVSCLSRCGVIADRNSEKDYFRQFNCPEGHYNELSTLLLNIGGKGIVLLFHENTDAFSITTCVVAGLIQLTALCICFGMSVSAGIFIPLLFSGACFGRAFGLMAGLDPRAYAIVGAAACLGGVVRVLISLTAIVTSTTSLSFYMTPIMVATLLAQKVGDFVSGQPGIYDMILQHRDVPFLEEKCPEATRNANIRARNIMKIDLVTLGTHIKVVELVNLLAEHSFSEFPVVDRDAEGLGRGTLVGSITRIDLISLLSCKEAHYASREEENERADKMLSFAELDNARFKCQEENRKGHQAKKEAVIHLSPYMKIAPHTFNGHGSAERAWDMFRCLGLRSLYVVDKTFCPIGVITRHELILLEEMDHGVNKVEKKVNKAALYSSRSDLRLQYE